MGLGFSTESKSSGDIIPIVKWDAKAGDMIRVDREQDASGAWIKNEEEVSFPCKFVADLETIEVGWLSFEGGAPDFRMVRIGEEMPERPSAGHKNAFRLRIYNKEMGLREFAHSAKTVLRKMDELHNKFEAERGANAGKAPVVEIEGAELVRIDNTVHGDLRFKVPNWKIVAWVDRPDEMAGAPAPAVDVPVDMPASEDDLF
jgi:hypothetical protein